MQTELISIGGWFFLGMSMGVGPCFGHSLLITLPYISMTKDNIGDAVKDILAFSLARIFVHALAGLLSALLGAFVHRWITSPFLISTVQILLGLFLVVLSVVALLGGQSKLCTGIHKHLLNKPVSAMAAAGFMLSFTPCPVMLGLLAYSLASGSWLYGLGIGVAFGLGSTVSPLLIGAPLLAAAKKLPFQGIKGFFHYSGAFLLFAYGMFLVARSL